MPGVEAEADERRVGARHEGVDLGRSFHERRTVMVEYRPQAGLVPHRAGGRVDAAGGGVPLRVAQSRVGSDASGNPRAGLIDRGDVRQHDHGIGGTGAGEERRRANSRGNPVGVPRRFGERDGDEGASEREAAGGDGIGEGAGVGRHEPPVAQLRADVAGPRDLVEHARIAGSAAGTLELEDAPRAGSVGEGGSRHGVSHPCPHAPGRDATNAKLGPVA